MVSLSQTKFTKIDMFIPINIIVAHHKTKNTMRYFFNVKFKKPLQNQNQPWAKILLSKYGGWKELISGRNSSVSSPWWKDLKFVFQQQNSNTICNP